MHKIIDWFVERSLIVNLLTLLIFAVGLISLYILPREVFPNVDFGYINITTAYVGSAPEDVELLVTIPLERKLKEVDGIEEMNAMSYEGNSVISLKVDADYDTDEVYDEVKTALDQVDDLPNDAEVPIAKKIVNKTKSVLKIALMGSDEEEGRRAAKNLQRKLEALGPIARVTKEGYRKETFDVQVDIKKLNRYDLTFTDVANVIRSYNLSISGGRVETDEKTFQVRAVSKIKNPEDIKKLIVRSNQSGQQVSLEQVATVKRRLKRREVYQRVDGRSALLLGIQQKSGADVVAVAAKVKKIASEYMTNFHPNMKITYVDDSSFYVKRRLNVLKKNGLQGIVLVLICLVFFMTARLALITSLGAPLAFMCAFFLMDALGITINLISMFGMILVLGMLVDDSIIVAEQFYQYREQGQSPQEAAKAAAKITLQPVTATILTTMVAFGALFFMGGIMGKFLWPVPAVVMICLFASWFECFFILPCHLADFSGKKAVKEGGRWYHGLLKAYGKVLDFCLRHAFKVGLLFLSLFVGTLMMAKKHMTFELFPADDVRTLLISFKGPVGTSLEVMRKKVLRAEKVALDNLQTIEYEAVRTLIGQQFGKRSSKTGHHYGMLVVYLTTADIRDRSTDDILASLGPKLEKAIGSGVIMSIDKLKGGPPQGKPIEVELSGEDLGVIKSLALKLKKLMEDTPGIMAVEHDFELGKQQIKLQVDIKEAQRLGVGPLAVAQELRYAYAGDSITEVRRSDEDIEVVIWLDQKQRQDPEAWKLLTVKNNNGRPIPMSNLLLADIQGAEFLIRRFDQRRTVSVFGELDRNILRPLQAVAKLRPQVDKLISGNADVIAVFGGENKDTKKSMSGLQRAGVIALFLIFIILVTMFNSLLQPFIVMITIPLGLMGVIWAFFIFSKPLSFMALMGVIGLIGVVVNDSIVLVTFINHELKETSDSLKAIGNAGRMRFRAVILTTFTTVAGLLPIAHAKGGDPFLKPMALSFAWGLFFATLLTLLLVPCLFQLLVRCQNWWKRITSGKSSEQLAEGVS